MTISEVDHSAIVSQVEWLADRKKILIQGKELSKHKDRADAERHRLPMPSVEKAYIFNNPARINENRIPLDSRIARVLGVLDAAFAQPPTLKQLSLEAHLSTSRLQHLFKKALGRSLKRYVSERRAQVAGELLEHTADPVSSICYAVGYRSLPAFANAFKSHFGQAPRSYRHSRWYGHLES
jgi:AraC family transcriptional regulator of arabinose operon